jgi:hypothetical protein
VTFVSVSWVIICVRLGPTTLGDYFAPRFWTPKTRVWHHRAESVRKEKGIQTKVKVVLTKGKVSDALRSQNGQFDRLTTSQPSRTGSTGMTGQFNRSTPEKVSLTRQAQTDVADCQRSLTAQFDCAQDDQNGQIEHDSGPARDRFNHYERGSFLGRTNWAEVSFEVQLVSPGELGSSSGCPSWTWNELRIYMAHLLPFSTQNTHISIKSIIFKKSLKLISPFKNPTNLGVSFQVKLRESKIFSSLLTKQNLVSSRGFVKISASWFYVFTWHNSISPLLRGSSENGV